MMTHSRARSWWVSRPLLSCATTCLLACSLSYCRLKPQYGQLVAVNASRARDALILINIHKSRWAPQMRKCNVIQLELLRVRVEQKQ